MGGIGNGSVIASAIIDANKRGDDEWKFAGYLNDRETPGSFIENYPVLGKISDCKNFLEKEFYFINTILRIDGQAERIEMFEQCHIPEERMATFVHPLSYIAPDVKLGCGTVVMPNVSISPGTQFGNGCLIMVGVTIGHDNTIGKYCHFAAQSCLGAYTNIGDGVHLGLNSTVRENITIGKNSTVGMGSVLTKNVEANEIWVGNPARFLRMAQ